MQYPGFCESGLPDSARGESIRSVPRALAGIRRVYVPLANCYPGVLPPPKEIREMTPASGSGEEREKGEGLAGPRNLAAITLSVYSTPPVRRFSSRAAQLPA